MKMVRIITAALAFALISTGAQADSGGRIHGRITTVDGEVFEGLIRWDKNEGSWVDFLNGNKELSWKSRSNRRHYADRRKKITIFGIPVGYSDTYEYNSGSAQSGVRFGHISRLEVVDDDAVLLTLKNGKKLELENGSTDIGTSIREIIIEDRQEGEIGFDWDDIESIDFQQGASDIVSGFGERLYGTVKTRHGDEFKGWICWDIDELFTEDVIDGEDNRRNRKIKFGALQAIERRNSKSAVLIMKNGDQVVLRGTNDVDDSNRGIVITDLEIGEIVVGWDDFDRLNLEKAPAEARYDRFTGGKYIEGTVSTQDGQKYTGTIKWDDDEEYTWEFIDGYYRDIDFNIEFANIAEIRHKGSRSAEVVLRNGRVFRLRGSNDVDEDNKGIYIEGSDGEEVRIDWDEFESAVFVK